MGAERTDYKANSVKIKESRLLKSIHLTQAFYARSITNNMCYAVIRQLGKFYKIVRTLFQRQHNNLKYLKF